MKVKEKLKIIDAELTTGLKTFHCVFCNKEENRDIVWSGEYNQFLSKAYQRWYKGKRYDICEECYKFTQKWDDVVFLLLKFFIRINTDIKIRKRGKV